MSEPRSFMALDWVKGEIEETLDRAREALESYVEQPDDITLARQCLTSLHQVNGTLQMVELSGAAVLAAKRVDVFRTRYFDVMAQDVCSTQTDAIDRIAIRLADEAVRSIRTTSWAFSPRRSSATANRRSTM